MEIERPTGDIDEYNRLNSLVKEDDQVIADRSMVIFAQTGWPPLRCRMKAIIEASTHYFNWHVNPDEAQRRSSIMSKWSGILNARMS